MTRDLTLADLLHAVDQLGGDPEHTRIYVGGDVVLDDDEGVTVYREDGRVLIEFSTEDDDEDWVDQAVAAVDEAAAQVAPC